MTDTDVLVIGAGPAGLTLANVLAQSGVDFRIVDKSTGPVEESRALVVHAKTLELLDKLGLAEEAVENGENMGAVEFLKEGVSAGNLDFFNGVAEGRTSYPMVLIHEQHKTERLLIENLEKAGKQVEWDRELVNLFQTSDSARATVQNPDGSEEEIEAGWIVGADGASSPVRHSLNLGFEGDTYEQTLFLADVDLDWELGAEKLYMDLTRKGFFTFFPMPGGEKRFRITGALSPEFADKKEVTTDEVLQMINENTSLDIGISEARWTNVYRIHSRMTERFRVERAFLIGDAAHIHSPAGGQGMNTGIGDAYNLAWKLALVVKDQAKEELLDSYEAERMPFARAILNGSDKGFSLQVSTSPIGQNLKLLLVPPLAKLASLAPFIKEKLFWFISQLWTQYRESPAAAQSNLAKNVKGPKAGERAPYGFYKSGESIFGILRDTDHHLLLFEGKKPDPSRLEASLEEIEGLLGRYATPVGVHQIETENEQLHERYGAKKSALFLIRPDGHVAYRGAAGDIVGLKMYLDRMFVMNDSVPNYNAGTVRVERSAKA